MDDIDFSLIVHPHGWTTFLLYMKGKTHEIIVSSVLSDALYDFSNLLLSLLNQENEIILKWFNEPGWYVIRVARHKEQQHMLTIEICFSNNTDITQQVEDYEPIVAFEMQQIQFLVIGIHQLKKNYHLLKDKSFSQSRKGEFPYELYQKLIVKVAETVPWILQ